MVCVYTAVVVWGGGGKKARGVVCGELCVRDTDRCHNVESSSSPNIGTMVRVSSNRMRGRRNAKLSLTVENVQGCFVAGVRVVVHLVHCLPERRVAGRVTL